MASTKYIGYVGGVAVAAGVGAAIAVAGQGTAHADSTDGAAKGSTSGASQHVKAGPKRSAIKTGPARTGSTKAGEDKRAKPVSTVRAGVKGTLEKKADKIEKTAAQVSKAVTAAKPSAEEFEAGQVAKLKSLFTPKQTAAPEPGPVEQDKPNTDIAEQIYRGSQIVPWVNAVIPISKILPSLAPALGSGPEALDARQTIIMELIKTTPPGSAVYYGYDIVADLINLEEPGAALKVQAVATVWDLLDPFELAHNKGTSGIGNAAG